MVLKKFCKLAASLYLVLIWFPLIWLWIYASLVGHDLFKAIGVSREQVRQLQPSTISDTYLTLSFLLFMLITLILAIWCFFPGNWLERLIRSLSPDGKTLKLTEIVIDVSDGLGPLEPVPVKIVGPLPDSSPKDPESNPDEKYMPPQYRQ